MGLHSIRDCAVANANTDADSYTDANANTDTDSYTDADANTNSDAYTDTHSLGICGRCTLCGGGACQVRRMGCSPRLECGRRRSHSPC